MKTFTILYAEDVPHYGSVDIEAANIEDAILLAKSYDRYGEVILDECDWSSSTCCRIAQLADETGDVIASGIPLDECFLSYGGDVERLLCDTAPAVLAALVDLVSFVDDEGEWSDFPEFAAARASMARACGGTS